MTGPTDDALDAATLLAGPRGRRLCLELAQLLDDDVRPAVFDASYDLDPGAGKSVITFGPGADDRPPLTARDVARRLNDAVFSPPDEQSIVQALATAVADARYWQEPDGADVLAAIPEVSEALRRIAEAVVTSRHAGWWSTPIPAGSQRAIRWRRDEGWEPFSQLVVPARLLADWRSDTVAEEVRAARERRVSIQHAASGTWWSAPPRALLRTTRARGDDGPVGLTLEEDSPGARWASVTSLVVEPGARVLEIDAPEDWADLCRRYPLTVSLARRGDWFRTTGRDGAWVQPDWSAVAQEVDAVHLSVRGYLTTSGRAVPVADGVASVLAGWDPDMTYWFAGAATDPTTAESWAYDEDADVWQRV